MSGLIKLTRTGTTRLNLALKVLSHLCPDYFSGYPNDLRPLVDRDHAELSVRRQCELLGVNRSSLFYERMGESEENLRLMRLLDEQYTKAPFYGSRRMTEWLITQGYEVNRKRISRLMEVMGIEAVYPKPKLSQPGEGHKIYPYLLRGVTVDRPDQVWSTDITYIRMAQGFLYLVAVMDWYSRYVLSWSLSLPRKYFGHWCRVRLVPYQILSAAVNVCECCYWVCLATPVGTSSWVAL